MACSGSLFVFFFKQKTAYEMRISDWSSDVCSSDLVKVRSVEGPDSTNFIDLYKRGCFVLEAKQSAKRREQIAELQPLGLDLPGDRLGSGRRGGAQWDTLMRNARQQAENSPRSPPAAERTGAGRDGKEGWRTWQTMVWP